MFGKVIFYQIRDQFYNNYMDSLEIINIINK